MRLQLAARARELGFDAIGVSGIDLAVDEAYLERWLEDHRHGDMGYMQRHGRKRSRPATLVPGTLRVISVRMNYWPTGARDAWENLHDGNAAYISRYATGRDYHKIMRRGLRLLANELQKLAGPHQCRIFVDSAPVLEKALARNAGLGWIGKHTNLISRDAGSYFFLGEIYTDLPLSIDAPASAHCGTCSACIPACPTGAITAPWQLDARRCISYLTIELKEAIPEELRPLIGNRIYGCDDCQLVCPWNKFAQAAAHPDFKIRNQLDTRTLLELFSWSADEFAARLQGSAIHRIGYERWLRNIAVALGNAPPSQATRAALNARACDDSALVREHVAWALKRQSS
jgi:epoxyqueuosine reductase